MATKLLFKEMSVALQYSIACILFPTRHRRHSPGMGFTLQHRKHFSSPGGSLGNNHISPLVLSRRVKAWRWDETTAALRQLPPPPHPGARAPCSLLGGSMQNFAPHSFNHLTVIIQLIPVHSSMHWNAL